MMTRGRVIQNAFFILCSETCLIALRIPPEAREATVHESLQIAVSPVDNLLSPFSISNFASFK